MSILIKPLFERMGKEPGIQQLVQRFYDLMDSLPEVKGIRDMHQADLGEARQKLYEFLVGWSGGPNLYIEKYGHPRLRMRHMPFPIGESERDQWMLCMRKAVEEQDWKEDTKVNVLGKFYEIADFMRNVE
jgi:hemoglobin